MGGRRWGRRQKEQEAGGSRKEARGKRQEARGLRRKMHKENKERCCGATFGHLVWNILAMTVARAAHRVWLLSEEFSRSWVGTVSTVHAVQYTTVQYTTVQYSTVQYSTVQYSTFQYNTVY